MYALFHYIKMQQKKPSYVFLNGTTYYASFHTAYKKSLRNMQARKISNLSSYI